MRTFSQIFYRNFFFLSFFYILHSKWKRLAWCPFCCNEFHHYSSNFFIVAQVQDRNRSWELDSEIWHRYGRKTGTLLSQNITARADPRPVNRLWRDQLSRSFKPFSNQHDSVKEDREEGKKNIFRSENPHESLVSLSTYLSFRLILGSNLRALPKTFPTGMNM